MHRLVTLAAALAACGAGSVRAQAADPAPPLPAPVPALSAAAVPAAAPAPASGPSATVSMKDGQSMHGRIVKRDPAGLTLDLGGGARLTIPADQIAEVREDGPGATAGWRPDPNRSRYLYSPSGFMLDKGEAYFSQTELAFTSVAFGVTDHVTIGLGSALPLLFARNGANLIGTLKVGGSISDYVHLAGGVQGLWLPGVDAGSSAGIFFGTVTLGTRDLHLGLTVGAPFAASHSTNQFGAAIFSVSGDWRVSPALALITENWFLPSARDSVGNSVNAFAVRIFGGNIAVDIGFLRVPGVSVPVPWLDLTYNLN